MKFIDRLKTVFSLLTNSRWIHLCSLTLHGNHLQMVELRIVGGRHKEDSVTIPAATGKYVVEYQTITYGRDSRISRMRAQPKGVATVLGEAVGTIDVDWGGIAVVDVDRLAPSIEAHSDEYDRWFKSVVFVDDAPNAGVFRWKRNNTFIPYADGGFGDGT